MIIMSAAGVISSTIHPKSYIGNPRPGPPKSRELGVRDLGSVESLGNLMGSELWGSAIKAD